MIFLFIHWTTYSFLLRSLPFETSEQISTWKSIHPLSLLSINATTGIKGLGPRVDVEMQAAVEACVPVPKLRGSGQRPEDLWKRLHVLSSCGGGPWQCSSCTMENICTPGVGPRGEPHSEPITPYGSRPTVRCQMTNLHQPFHIGVSMELGTVSLLPLTHTPGLINCL